MTKETLLLRNCMVCVLAYLYLKEVVDIFLYRFAQGNIYVCAASSTDKN